MNGALSPKIYASCASNWRGVNNEQCRRRSTPPDDVNRPWCIKAFCSCQVIPMHFSAYSTMFKVEKNHKIKYVSLLADTPQPRFFPTIAQPAMEYHPHAYFMGYTLCSVLYQGTIWMLRNPNGCIIPPFDLPLSSMARRVGQNRAFAIA